MAHQHISMGFVVILATALLAGVGTAQSSDCTNSIISLSPCLSYISGNSSSIAAGCCSQLSTVVGSQPQCLCEVLNGGGSNLGLNINRTRALTLPGNCNVQTPPLTQCNAASPDGAPGLAPDGSKTLPNDGDGFSAATSNKLGATLLLCLLFVASMA